MVEVKQVIIIRKDISMSTGKTVAQGAHASVMSYLEALKAHSDIIEQWLSEGQKKIVLKVDDDKAMKRLYEAFKFKKIPCALVNDAGLTQLPPGTMTALAAGPWDRDELDMLTGGLKLL